MFYPVTEPNILVRGHHYIKNDQQTENFVRLQQAIDERRRVSFSFYKRAEQRSYTVEPYQLINHNGVWYLAAKHQQKLRNLRSVKYQPLTAVLISLNVHLRYSKSRKMKKACGAMSKNLKW